MHTHLCPRAVKISLKKYSISSSENSRGNNNNNILLNNNNNNNQIRWNDGELRALENVCRRRRPSFGHHEHPESDSRERRRRKIYI
jgi:hypothetical protein